jgi:hypothetical protein
VVDLAVRLVSVIKWNPAYFVDHIFIGFDRPDQNPQKENTEYEEGSQSVYTDP